ncbi:hypothetical protein ABPG72_016582 [Tetrahymena utriculariae]
MATKRIINQAQEHQDAQNFQNVQEMEKFLQKPTDRVLCSYQYGVYDVTDFLPDHPGGKDLIEKYKGQDITVIFKDENSHPHSQNAKRILAQYKTGQVAGDNKESMREGEERPYPLRVGKILYFDDFQIDLDKGYFYQIWKLSYKQYLEVIDNPVTIPFYVPLFDSKFLDLFSRNKWYTILAIWVPIAIYHFYLGLTYDYNVNSIIDNYVKLSSSSFSLFVILTILLFAVFTWSLAEYSLHRFLFHMEKWMPDQALYRYLAFIIHGVHHALPMDGERLVFPPSLGAMMYYVLTTVIYTFLPGNAGRIFVTGFIAGYLYYDMMHYYLHHCNPNIEYFKNLKSNHNKHHYVSDTKGFGITNKIWDYVFDTKFN